jgi:hypothetical protein
VNNKGPAEDITGKITANPNPLVFGQRCVISWETNDPVGAEIRVSTGTDDEKLVTQGGPSGHVEIPWIKDSKVYEFRLYVASSPEVAIDSVKARRDIESAPAALREIADEVKRGNIEFSELSRFISAVMPLCLKSTERRELFLDWERHGFHVTPAHFYQPIPDTQSLPETLWTQPSELVGIDMNEAMQLDLLRRRGALLSKTIKSLDIVAYEDLGTESIKKLEVEGFPAIVCCDMYGGDLLLQSLLAAWSGPGSYEQRTAAIQAGTTPLLVGGNTATVFDDGAVDRLNGVSGLDWFFANVTGGDVISGKHPSEFVNGVPALGSLALSPKPGNGKGKGPK